MCAIDLSSIWAHCQHLSQPDRWYLLRFGQQIHAREHFYTLMGTLDEIAHRYYLCHPPLRCCRGRRSRRTAPRSEAIPEVLEVTPQLYRYTTELLFGEV